jgi:tetratricopeptide (TPR) repeat protein
MSDVRKLHDEAMDLFELGLLAARKGELDESRKLFADALKKETQAADSVPNEFEPTRSILHLSAASIALRIGDISRAMKYIKAGLAGRGPTQLKKEMETLREQILVLEAETKDYRLRAPGSRTLVEEISRQFRSTAPVDIVGLAKALGLAVRQADLGHDIAGEIFPDLYRGGFSGYTIRANSADSLPLKRLTIAHEVAHFLLHRSRIQNRLVDDRMYRSRLDSEREQAAEKLALDLLMPGKVLRELRSAGLNDPTQLADRFKVPLHAMKRRMGIRN